LALGQSKTKQYIDSISKVDRMTKIQNKNVKIAYNPLYEEIKEGEERTMQ